jgi:signal transduction histidine kinase
LADNTKLTRSHLIDNLFPPVAQINVYRIFQESLTNISRHAQATTIAINIEKQDGFVTCVIQDNGRGFHPQAVGESGEKQGGIGLATMYQRARIAGGRLEIKSYPEGGTQLTLTIPIQKGSN